MTDYLLEAWVSGLIERTKRNWMLGGGTRWKPGEPLKLLFAGYNGGAIRAPTSAWKKCCGKCGKCWARTASSLPSCRSNLDRTRNYFGDATQVRLPDIFPPFLYREVRKHHGVVACEGSMFKSKFANALTTMMIGSLGIAAAENKISIGYGGDAGKMDPRLRRK